MLAYTATRAIPAWTVWEDRDHGNSRLTLVGNYVVAGGASYVRGASSVHSNGRAPRQVQLCPALVERLKPRCLAMCGVCAGNPAAVALGDVNCRRIRICL